MGLSAKEAGGHIAYQQILTRKQADTDSNAFYDLQNKKTTHDDYQGVKKRSKLALVIAAGSAIISLFTLLLKCNGK